MVYSSPLPLFNRQYQVLLSARWWTAPSLQQLHLALSNIYYPAHASREAGLSLFNTLACAPFSDTVRFPTIAYATELNPYLSALFSQLQTALSYSDRLQNKNLSAVTSNDPIYLNSKASFFRGLLALSVFINDPLNYYDQQSFESAYTLTWS
jgi:hypothetical protein